ncbi:MAG: DUF1501 domain-containing protein [Pirellulales bacterium]
MCDSGHDLRQTRRQFFGTSALSLAPLALASLLDEAGAHEAHSAGAGPFAPRPPHHAPRAKRVIFLYMVGGPSQIDLFEPKSALVERDGQPIPESYLKGIKFAQIQEKQPRLMGSPWRFARHGQCGADVSELLPHTATVVDHLSIVKTMKADDTNHAFAELQMNTGWRRFGRPSMGSWISYGLGSESRDLPGFTVLLSGMRPRSKSANYGNGFLPSAYQGVPLRATGDPILNLSSPAGFTPKRERRTLETIRALDAARFDVTGDPEIAARISAYEMAFRMQTSAPRLLDLSSETAETLAMYGIADAARPTFARNCLLARRLVERGVRFVQLFHGDWDHHSHIASGLPDQCRQTDQPAAALVKDLAARGLLDETLVIWGGEFGRSSVAQGPKDANVGRDHNIDAFTMWLAGGGIRPGQTLGTTDELGCFAAGDSFHIYDLQATILHLLGLDHERLTYRFQGRDFRLTDVYGNVIEKLLA